MELSANAQSSKWLKRIRQRQQEFVTLEIREKMRQKASSAQKVRKRKKRAQNYIRSAEVAKCAWRQGNMMSPAAMGQMRSVQSMMRRQNIEHEEEALDDIDDMEDALGMIEEQQAEFAAERGDTDVDDDDLLESLKVEPTDDDECAVKFQIYETFLSTVEESRKATFAFWEECKVDFEGTLNAIAAVEKTLSQIDSEENLGIVFDDRVWFVHGMTKKANENNEKIKRVLEIIETKLDLLQREGEQCPFCLENLDDRETYTFSCCHRSCHQCWSHWREIKGADAFCPLCRQEDFLIEMAEN